MNTRLVITLLIVGALAFACGPRPRADVQAPLATAHQSMLNVVASAVRSASGTAASRKAEPAEVPRVDARLAVGGDSTAVHFDLAVRNVTHKHVELSFPTGKTYDFVVVDSA